MSKTLKDTICDAGQLLCTAYINNLDRTLPLQNIDVARACYFVLGVRNCYFSVTSTVLFIHHCLPICRHCAFIKKRGNLRVSFKSDQM